MVIPATTSPSPRPPPSVKPLPAKLRRQSTFERQPQSPPNLPQPTTPTLLSLSRSNSRSQSTPPQHTVSPSASFGESIFQSLSFGPFASGPSKQTGPSSHRTPPSRSSTMLSNVLEAPTQLESNADPGPETHHPPSSYNSGHSFAPSRRRVTSPDTTHPFAPTRTTSPGAEEAYAPATSRMPTSSPRSPPLAFGDSHPRKSRSTLRLSRLRPSSGRDDVGTESVPEMLEEIDRPGSARVEGGAYRPVSTRRPGSAGGEVARKGSVYRGPAGEGDVTSAGAESDRNGTVSARHPPVAGSRTRGMRVRASSELSRPAVPMSTALYETEGIPPPRMQRSELRPPLPVSSSSGSSLGPVPLSPGVQSAWSKQSGESALADDSDVDADAPTTPSLTTGNSRTASASNSSVNQSVSRSHPSQNQPTTPTPSFLMLGLDPLDRTQAREDADRRRREETAREREERAKQAKFFTRKGPAKERCHSYSPSEAPYPVSYTPRVLNAHSVDVDMSWQMISSLTYHAFPTPPAKVLDLGCGTGHWILRAAHEWTETQFVGFDLVPIQPSLTRVTGKTGGIGGNSHSQLRLEERIRWVHGNFLKRLPFEDGEFDMVRCRRIARGVPESKWDDLYEEIVRVMKPGAAFEHVEEDIIFPNEIPDKSSQSPLAVYPTPSPSYASSNPPYLSSTSLPNGARGSVPLVRPPDQYRRSPSTSFSSAFDSPVDGRHNIPSVSSTSGASNASIMSGSNGLAPLRTGSISAANPAATLVVPGSASGAPSPDVGPAFGKDTRESGDSAERGGKLPQDFSFYDPRVHTRLHELFVSMHDARWINLKPLSLIPRLIQEHLTGMISSPAFNLHMPPRPREGPSPSQVANAHTLLRVSGDAMFQQILKSKADEEGRGLDLSLLEPQIGDEEIAQYLTFDFLRMGSVSKSRRIALMPVREFTFQLAWLPMHLICAADEIIGCKEAMWEHLKTQDPGFDRREYDAMIRQYQTDMQDRIGISNKLREKLQWGPPESDFMRTADQRAFEDNYAQAIALDQASPETANRPPGVMRCMRAFVAWKPSE